MTLHMNHDLHKTRSLEALFRPKSIAVVGASRRPEAVGYAVFHNLVCGGFQGALYPVNPKADRIDYIPCYPSLLDIPGSVDLAVIVVPNVATAEVLKECCKKEVQAAIIISAGFREVGSHGTQLENEVAELACHYGIPLLGPNCLGLINTDPSVSMNASFSRSMPRAGKIAFISQSGALCTAVLDYAKGQNIGFSKFISLGNKADVTELDLLRYLKNDEQTEVILMYLEDLVNGRAFIETVREITGDLKRTKPVLAIKAGRTLQGAKAASSHTGSLMGSDEVYDAIFAQAGVLRIDSIGEMFDLAVAFANEPLPKGKRTAIVTNAGGPGIMMTDACIRYGLELSELEPSTKEALKKVLPSTASVSNPIDIIGDAQHDRYDQTLECVIQDPNVDSIIVILTPQAMTQIEETARVIVKYHTKKIPLVASFMGVVDVSAGVKILEANHISHYRFPEAAARAIAAMYKYSQWIGRPRTAETVFEVSQDKARAILENARQQNRRILLIHEAMQVIEAYGIPVLPFRFAKNEAEAVAAANQLGFPVVLKAVSAEVIHKFDVGGVRLKLRNEQKVAEACREIEQNIKKAFPQACLEGFFVQRMADPGTEVILGMKRDPHFGPILMFGLGGIYVEALKDVTFRLAPIRQLSAHHMLEDIRAARLLKGIRGERPADRDAIAECLQRLSQLSCEQPLIEEVDINPLRAYPEKSGVKALDARIVIALESD